MKIKSRYYYSSDFPTLQEWAKKWGIGCPTEDMLPKVGFVVENVAIAFLMYTDCSIVQIEFVITNPEIDDIMRQEALIALGYRLEKSAKMGGAKIMTGFMPINNKALTSVASILGLKDQTNIQYSHVIKYL